MTKKIKEKTDINSTIVNNSEAKTSEVEVVYVIDRSGSMNDLMSDAIGGFNAFVQEQKKENGECYLTLIAFDTVYEEIYKHIPIQEVDELTDKTVFARGGTALLDAVGKALSSFPADKNVIALIMTDGEENSSIEWKPDAIKQLVKDRMAGGWEINFVGVGIDAFKIGTDMGLQYSQMRNVYKSKAGVDQYSQVFTNSVSTYRKSK